MIDKLAIPRHLKPITLLVIVLLALGLRCLWITKSPPSLYVDETVIGYNAYSLAETGRDEYGQIWPVLLRSYGAFSSTLYTFVTAPIVKIFGLNTISVRLLSILSGVVLVVLIGWSWGLTAAWLTAITPVFIFFSRGAFEANFALTLFTAGLFIGINYLKQVNRTWLLLLSTLFFALSTYAYLAERFISPVLLLIIYFITTKRLVKAKRPILPVFFAIILFIFVSIPLLKVSFTSGANQRLQTLVPQNDSGYQFGALISRYYTYFSPQNLFSRPDPDIQRSYPELSTFYWWWLFPFIGGLFFWFKKIKKWSYEDWLLLTILMVSPLAGAITNDYFSTIRVLPMFIVIVWLIAKGINQFGRYRLLVIITFTVIGVTTLFYNSVLLRFERNKEWLYPYQKLALEVSQLKDKTVIIDNSRLKPFYIYYAYVNKVDPKIMQDWHNFNLYNYYNYYQFTNEMTFLNMQFKPLDFKDIYDNYYVITDELGISPSQAKEHYLQKITSVENLDGTIAYNIYETHPLDKCKNDLLKDIDKVNPFCLKYLK